MEKNLLQNDAHWLPYTGQELSIDGFIQVIKIKVDEYYSGIDLSILSAREIEKANRFVQQQDKERYLVSKYYLRLLLAHFLPLAPAAIEYSYTANHKPSLPGIEFNISHAGNYVVIALSRFPIGVDVEFIKRDFNFTELMEICFSPEELSFIHRSKDQLLSFYLLWTRKEAILKATGEGLTDHLKVVPALPEKVLRQGQSFKVESIKTSDQYIITTALIPLGNAIIQRRNWE